MAPDDQLADIARTIQLAVAPVFLLTALGTILSVLTTRLSRVVDRSRVLSARLDASGGGSAAPATDGPRSSLPPLTELEILARRRVLVNWAITCATIASLLVCLVVLLAFLGFMLHQNFSRVIASLFIGAMAMFISALLFFLREIVLTSATRPR
jgi:hypothetical protein